MFLDTLSLHMCISGLTGIQRILMNSKKTRKSEWMDVGSLNNLSDVFSLYTKNGSLDKATKDFFVEGNLSDILENFQVNLLYIIFVSVHVLLAHKHSLVQCFVIKMSSNGFS